MLRQKIESSSHPCEHASMNLCFRVGVYCLLVYVVIKLLRIFVDFTAGFGKKVEFLEISAIFIVKNH
jgi:hypothetical protein